MIETIITTAEEMMELGANFAAKAGAGDVFGLVGDLGTGKTHWAKGFIEASSPDATASSPTFGIVNEHGGGSHNIFHFDFYRLKSEAELLALGWDEYLDENGIVICEWADLFPDLMPENTTWLQISHLPHNSRMVGVCEKPVTP